MTDDYVELRRRFSSERVYPNTQDEYDWVDYYDTHSQFRDDLEWRDLLQHAVTVVIGTRGSGKTEELRHQYQQSQETDAFAFYSTVLQLASDPLDAILSEGQMLRYLRWTKGKEIAYFFVDSVDEAKATGADFERALANLARATRPNAHRARIVVSTRPQTWSDKHDQSAVERHLDHVLTQSQMVRLEENIDLLSPVIRGAAGKHGEWNETIAEVQKDGWKQKVHAVWLQPLSKKQIGTLAEALLGNLAANFLRDVEKSDVWHTLRTPLDVQDGTTFWLTHGYSFGSRAEQIDSSIEAKLTARTSDSRPVSPLPKQKARLAARRLAAALTLTKKRELAFGSLPQNATQRAGCLDAEDTLRDLALSQVIDLGERRLFEPAGYGTLQMHREYQEYLTAQWFAHLLEHGLPPHELARTTCVNVAGEPILRPTFVGMAPWLAQRHRSFRDILHEVAPEAIVSGGDISQLADTSKQRLAIALSERYAKTDDLPALDARIAEWLGSGIDQGVMKRLWRKHKSQLRPAQLILGIIGHAQRSDLASVALNCALDSATPERLRETAIWCIGQVGTDKQATRLAKSAMDRGMTWSRSHLDHLVNALFPKVIDVDSLFALVSRFTRVLPQQGRENLSAAIRYSMPRLSREELGVFVELAHQFVRRRPFDSPDEPRVSKNYSWLLHPLWDACKALLAQSETEYPTTLLKACKYVYAVSERRSHPYIDTGAVQTAISTNPSANRQMLFLALRTDPKLKDSPWMVRYYWPCSVADTDVTWLLGMARSTRQSPLAIRLFELAYWCSDTENRKQRLELEQVAATSGKFADKYAAMEHERVTARNRDEDRAKRQQERQDERALRDREIAESWESFRTKLQDNPSVIDNSAVLSAGKPTAALNELHNWLSNATNRLNRYAISAGHLLSPVFGEEVQKHYESGATAFWRVHPPPLESAGESFTTWGALALAGITIEAERDPDWAEKLEKSEAQRAAQFATRELNGFPIWLNDLAAAHPLAVGEVFAQEFEWELRGSATDDQRYHCASRLAYSEPTLRDALAPVLFNVVAETAKIGAATLERILRVLLGASTIEVSQLANLAKRRWREQTGAEEESAESVAASQYWLVAWLYCDAHEALHALKQDLAERSSIDADSLFGGVLTKLVERDQPQFQANNYSFDDSTILRELTLLAYRHIRIAEDTIWEPGVVRDHSHRDDLEAARGGIRKRLTASLGENAIETLREFATHQDFEPHWKYLLKEADRLAVEFADIAPWSESAVHDYELSKSRPIENLRDLYEVTQSCLLTIRDQVQSADDSEKALLRGSTVEADHQRFLLRELNNLSKQRFSAVRENEVVEGKFPDICTLHPSGNRVPIEVKVADSWRLDELLSTIETQLVDRYLAHPSYRFGALVVTRCKQRTWSSRATGKCYKYPKLLAELRAIAAAVVAKNPTLDDVAVVSIDLKSNA